MKEGHGSSAHRRTTTSPADVSYQFTSHSRLLYQTDRDFPSHHGVHDPTRALRRPEDNMNAPFCAWVEPASSLLSVSHICLQDHTIQADKCGGTPIH